MVERSKSAEEAADRRGECFRRIILIKSGEFISGLNSIQYLNFSNLDINFEILGMMLEYSPLARLGT